MEKIVKEERRGKAERAKKPKERKGMGEDKEHQIIRKIRSKRQLQRRRGRITI